MKTYLVSELTKSGSDVGELLEQGVNGELGNTQKDIKAQAEAILKRKQAEKQLER